jgi:hypothetical protein
MTTRALINACALVRLAITLSQLLEIDFKDARLFSCKYFTACSKMTSPPSRALFVFFVIPKVITQNTKAYVAHETRTLSHRRSQADTSYEELTPGLLRAREVFNLISWAASGGDRGIKRGGDGIKVTEGSIRPIAGSDMMTASVRLITDRGAPQWQ